MELTKREHVHMKYVKPFVIMSGTWPLELKGLSKFLYDVYFYTTFTYFLLNVGTVYITAKEIAAKGKPTEITDFTANAVFTTLLIFKVITYKSKGVQEVLDLILKSEEDIFNKYNSEAKNIYMKNAAATQLLASIFIFQGVFVSFCAQIFPLIMTFMSKPDESGHVEKYYIVPNWEPFDKYKYYYTTFIIQFFYTCIAETYIVFGCAFFLSILKHISGQFKVLQYRFASIYEDAVNMSNINGISFKEACNVLVKDCIRHHQDIIKLVVHVDKTFGKYIFIEYGFTSFGLSIVVLEFLLEETVQMKIAAAGFFFAFASQNLIIYYHADEFAWESNYGLTRSIFASNWFKIDISAKKLLVFVIMRAQKPLSLSIGPFRKVGVDSMIALFKATYSYLSVMWS